MFVEGRHYKLTEKESEYRMIQDYVHLEWLSRRPPIMDDDWAGDGVDGVTFHKMGDEGVLTLHTGYMWNGSRVVRDNPECMRASAIHDAWCKAMNSGQYRNVEENWDRGAHEYAVISVADGLEGWRTESRAAAINFYGDVAEITHAVRGLFRRKQGHTRIRSHDRYLADIMLNLQEAHNRSVRKFAHHFPDQTER